MARYKERYGLTSDPLSTHEQFRQWRREQVTSFVRQMYARIQKTKPWIKQSGAFVTWNPSPASSTRSAFLSTSPYSGVYSDWDGWMQEGIVDIAVPMTYYREHVHANDYRRWMNFEKDRKFNRHLIVGPGIYLNYLTNAILHLNLTRAASPAGNYAHGFSGYSYRAPYTLPSGSYGTWPNFSPTLVAEVTPTWDDIPPMPWKTSPTHGHLMGVVTLAGSGAWADHAVVTLTGPVNRSQYVDSTGFYAFIDLPPGSYTVTASRAGYANAQAGATVALGEVTGNMYERNLVLDPAAPPTIITHPASLTVAQGHNAAFAVAAESPSPPTYQWRFNGVNLPGATTANYTRLNAQPADAGGYSVVVGNAFGAVTSSVATLTVVVPPVIATAPQSQVVTQSVNVTFTVTASGTGARLSMALQQPAAGRRHGQRTHSQQRAAGAGWQLFRGRLQLRAGGHQRAGGLDRVCRPHSAHGDDRAGGPNRIGGTARPLCSGRQRGRTFRLPMAVQRREPRRSNHGPTRFERHPAGASGRLSCDHHECLRRRHQSRGRAGGATRLCAGGIAAGLESGPRQPALSDGRLAAQ